MSSLISVEIQQKVKFLKNVLDHVKCFSCNTLPGFTDIEKERYSCSKEAHSLCAICKVGSANKYLSSLAKF